MKRQVIAEFKKVKDSLLLYMSVIMLIVWFVYVYIDFKNMQYTIEGYYVSSVLLSLTLFGSIIPIITGSLLMAKEREYNTLIYNSMVCSRSRIVMLKVLCIVFISLLEVFFTVAWAFALSIVSGDKDFLPNNFFQQFVVVFFVLCFWGIVAFALECIFNYTVVSILLPILLIFFENIFYTYCSEKIIHLLPLYNIRSVLYELFNNLKNDSMISVPEYRYHYGIGNYMYIIIFLLCTIFIGKVVVSKSNKLVR